MLHRAAWGGKLKFARELIQLGADVDTRNNKQQTPLHLAAKEDRCQVVELLIHHGADVESKDRRGKTPLQYASVNGESDTVEMLLKGGAQIDLNSAVLLNRFEDLRNALPSGLAIADAPFPDELLYYAAFWQHEECVKVLLDNGADPNLPWKGSFPLHAAVGSSNCNPKIVNLLLQAGANPTVRDSTSNESPLEKAQLMSVDPTIIELLQDHKAM